MIKDPFNENIHISNDGLLIWEEVGNFHFDPADTELIDLLNGRYKLGKDPNIVSKLDLDEFYRRWYGY